jgi:hypothetical protein
MSSIFLKYLKILENKARLGQNKALLTPKIEVKIG